MNIELLRYYIKVAETLSFKEAAEKMFTSQSTLSRGIHALEKELGVKLFDRTTRKVQLSEAGLSLLDDARKLITDYDTLMLKVSGLSGNKAGIIRIGYFRNENAEYLARIVERMRIDYPAVTIEYMKAGLPTLSEGLENGFLDAVLVYHSCLASHDKQERFTLAHEYPQLIVFQEHRLAEKKYVEFRDLQNEIVIVRKWKDIPDSVNESTNDFFREQGIHIEDPGNDFNWGRQMMRIRLGECVMLDAFATSSIGQPEPFCVVPVISEDNRFDRDMIIRKDNTNSLIFSLKKTVQNMILEKQFE